MTTQTPVMPPPLPERIDPVAEAVVVAPEVETYRRRLRRRLVIGSLPVVILLALIAVKLLSMPILAGVSQATYDRRSYENSVVASDGLAIANLFEPWVQHFERGAALGQIGVLTQSRAELESALALVPESDTRAGCMVRTDLVLVVEQQGDSAVLDQATQKADAFYTHALGLIKAAPEGCFRNPSGPPPKTKKPLDDAQSRLQQKQQATGGSGSTGGGQNGQGQGGGQQSQGQGQGDQSQSDSGSSGSGDPLKQLQQQNGEAQKEQQQNDDRQRQFSRNPEDYSGKPW